MRSVLAPLLLVQTVPNVVTLPDAARFDLAKYRLSEARCTDTLPIGDDVLVCARLTDLPRSLEEQAAIFEPKPFRPAWRMLGGEGGLGLEQRSTLIGSAPAAMVTFKLKF